MVFQSILFYFLMFGHTVGPTLESTMTTSRMTTA